jgi:hypothetical protein
VCGQGGICRDELGKTPWGATIPSDQGKIALLERREIGVHQWACLIALKVDPTWPAPTHYEICITGHRQRTVQHRGLGSIKNAPQADLASRIAGFT